MKNKRKRGASGRVESEEDADTKKKKETQRPNYFVSIPITNPKVQFSDIFLLKMHFYFILGYFSYIVSPYKLTIFRIHTACDRKSTAT